MGRPSTLDPIAVSIQIVLVFFYLLFYFSSVNLDWLTIFLKTRVKFGT